SESVTWSSALHNLVGLRLSDLRRLARPRLAQNKRKSSSDGQRDISLSSASGQRSPCSLISGTQLSVKTVFGSSSVSSLLFR
ncbi:hypothetical protein PO909_003690, partial [Leuciscus waleckii]